MKRSHSKTDEFSSQSGEDSYTSSSKVKKKKKRKTEIFEDYAAMVKDEPVNEFNESVSLINSSWENSDLMFLDEQNSKKKKKKKKKTKKDVEDTKIEDISEIKKTEHTEEKSSNGVIKDLWPKEKMLILLNRIKEAVPTCDNLKYTSRLSKLDWNSISFDKYNGSECENMWKQIQEKIRCFRLLKEIITDAEMLLSEQSDSFYDSLKIHKHPEKPSQPLSSFMLFYMDSKDKIQKEYPGTSGAEVAKRVGELWKNINPKKLQKYKTKAQQLRKEYEEKLAKFYQNHPECIKKKEKKSKNKTLLGFERPKSAFQLYLQSNRETSNKNGKNLNDKEFLEKCKLEWKNMPECDKVTWIKSAQKEEEIYRENLKKYESEHPGFVPPTVKTIITKNEQHVLENCSGKPKKPPSNAYSLYSTLMLQSDSLKTIPSKERLTEISKKWKSLEESEKKIFVKQLQKLQDEYAEKYKKYLNSLSPQKRQEEEIKTKKKRKLEGNFSTKKVKEPEKPPTDPIELFRLKHENEWKKKCKTNIMDFTRKKWEKLKKSDKKEYIEELKQLNDEYELKFGEFIQHCPSDQVSYYLNKIVRHKQEVMRNTASETPQNSDNDSE